MYQDQKILYYCDVLSLELKDNCFPPHRWLVRWAHALLTLTMQRYQTIIFAYKKLMATQEHVCSLLLKNIFKKSIFLSENWKLCCVKKSFQHNKNEFKTSSSHCRYYEEFNIFAKMPNMVIFHFWCIGRFWLSLEKMIIFYIFARLTQSTVWRTSLFSGKIVCFNGIVNTV